MMHLSEVERRIRNNDDLHDLVIPSGILYPELLVMSNTIKASLTVEGALGTALESIEHCPKEIANIAGKVNGLDDHKGPLDEKLFDLAGLVVKKLEVIVITQAESPAEIVSVVEAVSKLREAFYGKSAPLIQLNTQNLGGGGGGQKFSGLLKR